MTQVLSVKTLVKTALVIALSFSFSSQAIAEQSTEERIKRLEEAANSRGQLQTDLLFQINAMQQELQLLRGSIEEHAYLLKQLQDRQRDLYRDIERRLSQVQNNSSSSSTNTSTAGTSVSTPPVTTAKTTSGLNEHEEYQKIFPLVRERKYDEAVAGYLAFLNRFPDGDYASNAHYWLGQVYFVRGEFPLADAQFKIVSTKFKNSAKAADALLKQGQIKLRQQDVAGATKLFEQVINEYDGTTEQLAKKELQKLKSLN